MGNDKKELSITITNAPAAEHTITVTTAGGGTASASSTSATAGTEITLTATPNTGYHFKEWQVESLAGLVITNNKFTMPDSNVTIKAIFEEDSPFGQEIFTDPRLQELIEQGLRNNTDLQSAQWRVKEAEAAMLSAKLAYLPSSLVHGGRHSIGGPLAVSADY